ncbi:hypothetical protein DXG01_003265 [Tephrocybe rancida]|nr:hypothetical protein DXG01_003265 [Tephrocybe rancida]
MHARPPSFLGGLMNLLSASSVTSSSMSSPQSSRFPTGVGLGMGTGTGIDGPATEDEDVDPEAALPEPSVPPAVLGVDLRLAPGESRTFGRPPRPYDLLWPISHPPLPHARVYPSPLPPPSSASKRPEPLAKSQAQTQGQEGTLADLADYTRRLLLAFPPPASASSAVTTRTVRIKLPAESVSLTPVSPLAQWNLFPWAVGAGPPAGGGGGEREGELAGCAEAVEILSRSERKAPVPHNPRKHKYKYQNAHASHHASFTLCTLRTTFSLDIPSDASLGPACALTGPGDTGTGVEGYVVFACWGRCGGGGGRERRDRGERYWGEKVYIKGLVRDGPRGEWGSAWVAPGCIAPFECAPPLVPVRKPRTPHTHARMPKTPKTPGSAGGWSAFLAASLFGSSLEPTASDDDDDSEDADEGPKQPEGPAYTQYDGIRPHPSGGAEVGVDYDGGGEGGGREMRLETGA